MWNRITAAILVGLAGLLPAHATTLVPMSLDEIVGSSDIAFQGTVVGNRTGRDANNIVVTYTLFQVNDVLKGSVPPTYEIKQVGGELGSGGLSYVVHGVPKFTVGQEYVVFMAGVSNAGFSSPIGLSSGKFDVRTDASGAKAVSNGRDFADLTANIPATQLPANVAQKRSVRGRFIEMDLDAFKSLVRDRAAAAAARAPQ